MKNSTATGEPLPLLFYAFVVTRPCNFFFDDLAALFAGLADPDPTVEKTGSKPDLIKFTLFIFSILKFTDTRTLLILTLFISIFIGVLYRILSTRICNSTARPVIVFFVNRTRTIRIRSPAAVFAAPDPQTADDNLIETNHYRLIF